MGEPTLAHTEDESTKVYEAGGTAAVVAVPEQRYRLVGEIARGGMGVVHRAVDAALGRDVAVKVLHPTHAADPRVAQRFLDEARITGRLQHPGVPAVYDLGTLPGGGLFLAMKLIRGHTLENLLRDPVELVANPVAVFEQICQTVGYAHAHGVIHRDLKPSNVMVGAFGEVQVVDWGLAKHLPATRPLPDATDPEAADSNVAGGGQESNSNATRHGAVLGTPAFMSPEQASGETDRVDERSDVFGLGAILCVVLTGRPPYAGGSTRLVLEMAARGRLDDCLRRLDECGGEPELVALCKRCLAPVPEDRPRNAEVVAGEVAALRADAEQRARHAELEQAQAQAEAREQRKRRRVQFVLAAVVLLSAAAAGIAWGWVTHRDAEFSRREADRERAEAAERAEKQGRVETAIAAAFQARVALDWPAALAEVKRAEALLEGLPPNPLLAAKLEGLRQAIADGQADRKFLADLNGAAAAGSSGPGLRSDSGVQTFGIDRTVAAYRQAFADFGLVAGSTPPAVAAARIAGRPKPVRDEAVAALTDWKVVGGHELVKDPNLPWVNGVIDALGSEGEFRRLNEIGQNRDPARRAALAREFADATDVVRTPVRNLPRLATGVRLLGAPEAACRLLLRAQGQHPGDFWINLALARGHEQYLSPEQVIRFGYAALASRPESGTCRHNLFMACCAQLRWHDAAQVGQWFLDNGEDRPYRLGLQAYVLDRAGRATEAEGYYRRLLSADGENPQTLAGVGLFLRQQGRVAEAEKLLARSRTAAGAEGKTSLVAVREMLDRGQYAEALGAASGNKDRAHPLVEMYRSHAARQLQVAGRAGEVVAGRYAPTSQVERLRLEEVCRIRGFNGAAVRLAAEAFLADPQLPNDIDGCYRYRGACCAALVAAGKDAAGPLDEDARRRHADTAQEWLAADLRAWSRRADEDRNGPAVREAMTRWKGDAALAAVRDPSALAALPASSRERLRALWSGVEQLLQRVPLPAKNQ